MKNGHKAQILMPVVVIWIASLTSAYAQSLTGEEVLSKFNRAVESLSSLHYTTHTIDSFISGSVRVQHGEAKLIRDVGNRQFPFRLYGRDDNQNEFIFDGKDALNIYHGTNEFEFHSSIHYRTFIGLRGGQMILEELLFPETPFDPETGLGYKRLVVQEVTNQYILTLHYPDNTMYGIQNRIKILTIDKKHELPISIYHTLETTDGEKQVNIRYHTNIRVNDPSISFPSIDTASLVGYREVKERSRTRVPTYADLLNTNFIDMKLKNIDGSTAQLSERKGKVVMLAFWETWCGPCIQSIPKINQFVSKYSPDAFEVWSIASDEKTFTKIPSVVKRTGINYPVYYGTEQIKKDYRVTGFPEYVIIDQAGKIIFIEAGFTDKIEKTLDELLK